MTMPLNLDGASTKAESIAPETVIAKVNGEDVTQGDLISGAMMQVRQMFGRSAEQLPPEQLNALVESILPSMRGEVIKNILMVQAADKKVKADNITVSDEEVDDAIAMTEERLKAQGATLNDLLQAQGVSLEEVKKNIYAELARGKGFIALLKDYGFVEPTEEEIKKFYDENPDKYSLLSASHILVVVDENTSDTEKAAAKTKAEDILKKVKDGGDFAALAKEYSDCPSSQKGGDLGSFQRGQMVPEFEAAVVALSDGEVSSGVVKTQFGYHIIKAGPRTQLTLDQVHNQIERTLSAPRIAEPMAKLTESLEKSAVIEDIVGKTEFAPPQMAPDME